MRVLIVEDEAAIAEEVAAYAAREGYETLWAADGEAAVPLGEIVSTGRMRRVPARPEGAASDSPVARATVEAHGGTIEAGSRLGEGRCFTVTLPPASEKRL